MKIRSRPRTAPPKSSKKVCILNPSWSDQNANTAKYFRQVVLSPQGQLQDLARVNTMVQKQKLVSTTLLSYSQQLNVSFLYLAENDSLFVNMGLQSVPKIFQILKTLKHSAFVFSLLFLSLNLCCFLWRYKSFYDPISHVTAIIMLPVVWRNLKLIFSS